MERVEFARYRWWFTGWIVALVIAGFIAASMASHATVDVNGTSFGGGAALTVALSNLASIPMYAAMIFATSVGISLNRESETRALSWTTPLSRPSIALRVMVVDVAMLATLFAVAWVVLLSALAVAGVHAVADDGLLPSIAGTLGVAVMWYALVQALTAGLGRNWTGIAGFLWPVAFVVSLLNGRVGGAFGAIVTLLNVVNPLAYAGGAPGGAKALVWLVAIALGAIAVVVWTRRED